MSYRNEFYSSWVAIQGGLDQIGGFYAAIR